MNEKQSTRTLVFLQFVGAAVRDATPEQRAAIRPLIDGLKTPVQDGGTPLGDIARQVADVMGPEWLPDDETIACIETLTGKKLRP